MRRSSVRKTEEKLNVPTAYYPYNLNNAFINYTREGLLEKTSEWANRMFDLANLIGIWSMPSLLSILIQTKEPNSLETQMLKCSLDSFSNSVIRLQDSLRSDLAPVFEQMNAERIQIALAVRKDYGSSKDSNIFYWLDTISIAWHLLKIIHGLLEQKLEETGNAKLKQFISKIIEKIDHFKTCSNTGVLLSKLPSPKLMFE